MYALAVRLGKPSAVVIASLLSVVLVTEFLRLLVLRVSTELFERGEPATSASSADSLWRIDKPLFRAAAGPLGALPVIVGVLAILLWYESWWPQNDLRVFLIGSLAVVFVLTALFFLSLCAVAGYGRSGLSQALAGQSTLHIWTVVCCYVLLVLAGDLELAASAAGRELRLMAGVLTGWHLFATLVAVFVLFFVARMPKGVPGRRSIRLLMAPISPIVLVSVNLGVAWWLLAGHGNWIGIGWCLAVGPLVLALPFLRVAHFGSAEGSYSRENFHVDLVRAKLVLATLAERRLPFFGITLPYSASFALPGVWGDSISVALGFAATFAWLGPFAVGLFFIEETFEIAYQTQLRRCIQRLRHQVLVLGYGDLGRRFVRELFQLGVVSYDSAYERLTFAWNILLPNGDLAKVLTRVAIVESDGTQVQGVVRRPGNSQIGHVSVARTIAEMHAGAGGARSPLSPQIDYIVPVIVGDASSEETQNTAHLKRAAFVACLIRDSHGGERSFGVFHRLDSLARTGIRVPAAIVIHSSTTPPYITERVLADALPVHYIFTEHLEGLNAANLVHSLYRHDLTLCSLSPSPVVICGRGKRLFYLLDSFLKSMGQDEYADFAARQRSHPFVSIVTTDDVLVKNASQCDADKDYPKWSAAKEIKRRFDLKRLSVARYVSRSPSVNGSDNARPVAGDSVDIPVIPRDGRDYQNVLDLLALLKPEAVLVSDHEADDEFRAINAIATSSAKLATENPTFLPPVLLVAGETGKRHLESNFHKAVMYYHSVWRGTGLTDAQRKDPPTYPTAKSVETRTSRDFRGDPLIDVLVDPTERLIGLARAYLGRRSGEVPVEINFCVSDQAGSLGSNLAGLAGYEVEPGAGRPLSFTNSRFVAKPASDSGFIFRSFVEQQSGETGARGFARVAVTSGSEVATRGGPKQRARVLRDILPLVQAPANPSVETFRQAYHHCDRSLPDRELDEHGEIYPRLASPPDRMMPDSEAFTTLLDTYKNQAKQCCGMPTCPIEAYHKTVLPVLGMQTQHAMSQVESIIRSYVPDAWNHPSPPRTEDKPLALVRVECSLGNRPGSFAVALNSLLLRRLKKPASAPERPVFNFTYISTHECHDERFGVFTCYGYRTHENHHDPPDVTQVIKEIEIRQVTGEWFSYANELVRFLSSSGRTFELDKRPDGYVIKPSSSGPHTSGDIDLRASASRTDHEVTQAHSRSVGPQPT